MNYNQILVQRLQTQHLALPRLDLSRPIQLKYIILLMMIQVICTPVWCFGQKQQDRALEKMPEQLESTFAVSSLPEHLRKDATVYLLDPAHGYYIVHQGSNGFICFVARTEWEWAYFSGDLATAVSYDAEGARTIFPVYRDVAAMRATGKFTALQIRDSVILRINKSVYKPPSRPGISYMLAPLMRSYSGDPGNNEIMTMSVPHYMFYAPYLTDEDIGGMMPGPFIGNPGDAVLGKNKGPHGYIIVMAGETKRKQIMAACKDLLEQLAAYKPYFKIHE
jgi:hypothetical protein